MDLPPANINTNGSQTNDNEVAETELSEEILPSYSEDEIQIFISEDTATVIQDEIDQQDSGNSLEDAIGNLLSEDTIVENQILPQNGGNNIESKYLQSIVPCTSVYNTGNNEDNILNKIVTDDYIFRVDTNQNQLHGDSVVSLPGNSNIAISNSTEEVTRAIESQQGSVTLYDSCQSQYQLPIANNIHTGTAPDYTNVEQSNDNVITNTVNSQANVYDGIPRTFSSTNYYSSEFSDENSINVENDNVDLFYSELQPRVITMPIDDGNIDIIDGAQNNMQLNALIHKSPTTEDSRVDLINSANELSEKPSTSASGLEPKCTQKRKRLPLYAQPEPEDPEEKVRWKRACTTERNRREKNERTNALEKELGECMERNNSLEKELNTTKKKLSKYEKEKQNGDAKIEVLTKEKHFLESLMKNNVENSNKYLKFKSGIFD
ncbi:unnamed protein product [Meganyctiphanes norvegica]|uniref:BZIP domain-containing protein n=1 Tax=Meganyctiphanes norvegica TaxID=48144 RepID=A0AAV2S2R7_MEGNR